MWGREMRAGLVFLLVSLVVGGAFREWRRSHESRFRDFVASLEAPEEDEDVLGGPRGTPPAPFEGARSGASRRAPAGRRAAGLPRPGRLDLDRADASDWERLPGIGPALARRIVADREARGPFREPAALLRVPGIGPRTLERIRPFLDSDPGSPDSQAAN